VSGRSFAGDYREAICDSDLSPSARLVAHALACHLNARHGALVWPSKEHLAEDTGLSLNTVQKAIRELEDAGYVTVRRSRGRSSNRYTLLISNQSVADGLADAQPLKWKPPTPQNGASSPSTTDPESIECFESGALRAAAAFNGAAQARTCEDHCDGCQQRRPHVPGDPWCVVCSARKHADAVIVEVAQQLGDARRDTEGGRRVAA